MNTSATVSVCSAVMFAGVSAPSARLRVSMAGGPEYVVEVDELACEEFRPNGEDCPPECLIATITLKVSSFAAALHHTYCCLITACSRHRRTITGRN